LPLASKFQVMTDEEADWWICTGGFGKGVYDEFRLSNRWNVYVYALPDAAAESYTLGATFPYPPSPVTVGPIDEISGKPAGGHAASVNFGSFLEVERAGGGFAMLS